MTTTNLNQLVINKMTKLLYNDLTSPSTNELYMITDDTGLTAGTGININGSTINHASPGTGSTMTTSNGTAGNYALNTEYTVLTGVTLNTDALGHVTGISTTRQKIKDTNNTYTVGNLALKIASNSGTTTNVITMNESSNDKTLTLSGDNTWIKGTVSSGTNAVTVTFSHDGPSTGSAMTTSNGTSAAYAFNTEYEVLTGVTVSKDTKGHITGISTTRLKLKDTNISLNIVAYTGKTNNTWYKVFTSAAISASGMGSYILTIMLTRTYNAGFGIINFYINKLSGTSNSIGCSAHWMSRRSFNVDDVKYDIDTDTNQITIYVLHKSAGSADNRTNILLLNLYERNGNPTTDGQWFNNTSGTPSENAIAPLNHSAGRVSVSESVNNQDKLIKSSDSIGTFNITGISIDSSNNLSTSGTITAGAITIGETSPSGATTGTAIISSGTLYIESRTAGSLIFARNGIELGRFTSVSEANGSNTDSYPSHFIPKLNNKLQLGDSTHQWVGTYITNLNASNLASGTVAFARLPSLYAGKIAITSTNTNDIYAGTTAITSAASYQTTPEVAIIKINGDTSASAASTKNCTLQYDSTLQTLKFVFA